MYKLELVNIMYNVLDRKGRPEERKQLRAREKKFMGKGCMGEQNR